MGKTNKIVHRDDIKLYDDWLKLIKSKGGILHITWNPESRPGNEQLHKNYEFIKQKMLHEYKLIMEVESRDKYYMLTKAGERATEIGMEKYVEELKYRDGLELESLKANIKTADRSFYLSLLAIFAAIIVPVLMEYIDYKKSISNTENNSNNRSNNQPANCDTIVPRPDSANFVDIFK